MRVFDFAASMVSVRAELASRPPFLGAVFERVTDRMQRRPKSFVELHGAQGLSRSDRRRLEPRLEPFRKAIVLVTGVLLTDLDIPSQRAAKLRSDGAFSGIGHERIAERAGLNVGRVGRVIGALLAAGYVEAHQPREPYMNAAGALAYCAHNTIYRLTDLFFRRCDYDKRLARERRSAAERRASRVRVYAASLLRARRAWKRLRTFGSADYLNGPAGPPRPRQRPPDRT